MLKIRKAGDRGFFNHGWLKTYHTFSFADYHDPDYKGFKTLRVINEDYVEPQNGFGTHAHRDMNILTCIVSGTLEHKDSMGNGSQIRPGEWQFMSAGSGVEHSEFNPSKDTSVHLLQIWIRPNAYGLPPRYGQLEKSPDSQSFWRTVASQAGGKDTIKLDQNASVHHARMKADETKSLDLKKEEGIWIQLISGGLDVNGIKLQPGDGLAIENESKINLKGEVAKTELIVFELF